MFRILEKRILVDIPYIGNFEILAILRNQRSIEYTYRSFYLEDHL